MIQNDSFDDNNDNGFYKEFQFLREIEPPSSLESKCVVAAIQAVKTTPHGSANVSTTIWRQAGVLATAVAASLLVGISIGWSLRGKTNDSGIIGQVAENSDFAPLGSVVNAKTTSVVYCDEWIENNSFRQEETYLCGVGRISSKSMIQFSGE